MDALAYSLKTLTTRVADGSHATRANRHRGLQAMAAELKTLGYRLPGATSLKPKHIDALVSHWKGEGINDRSIRNRLGWARWWAEQINKPGLIPASNESFGLAERTPYQGNRARKADSDTLARVADSRIRLALKLEAAFGLRREEALKFRPAISDHGDHLALVPSTTKGGRYREIPPAISDHGDHLALVPSTTKGGRYREIPLTDPRQRALLEEVHAVAGDGSLIPAGTTYREYLNRYKHQTLAAGLGNAHGLRHAYAQWRYARLTGWKAPAAGGPTLERLTPEQVRRDRAARLQVSRELGHNRLDIADTYLGRVKAFKVAA